MKNRKILVVNLAVLSALLALVSIFFLAKHFDDASYVSLLLAALVLVVVDAMRIFVKGRVPALIWSTVFTLLSICTVEEMLDMEFFLTVISGVLAMLLVQLLPRMVKDNLFCFICNMKIWGMLIYAIFNPYGGLWRFFVAIGIGVVATVPSVLINIVCKSNAERKGEEKQVVETT